MRLTRWEIVTEAIEWLTAAVVASIAWWAILLATFRLAHWFAGWN